MPTLQSPHEILEKTFGFPQFRPGQEAVVERLLAGQSALAIFPTGGGKSLCYQIPALLLEGITLVISPLIALMKDQIDALTRCGVAAARLDSSQDAATVRQVYRDLRSGHLKLLYIAPERLANERFLNTLRQLPIALLAVDEAHCISEWGHNFRPDYLKIASLRTSLGIPRVLGLTATATPAVAASIAKAFDIPDEGIIHTGFYRPNLTLYVTPTPTARRTRLLTERLAARPPGPTIVYVTLQRTAEEVAAALGASGWPARAYHAGLDPELRHQVQDWFMGSDRAIVVATIAFGMGIDKSDIRYVYHFNLPKSLENYAQEIGRAGRDAQPSICELLASPEDVTVLENFTYGDTPTVESLRSCLDALRQGPTEFDISTYELSNAHDIRPLVIDTLLTWLELDGFIQSTHPFYSGYKLELVRSPKDILARFDTDRRTFVQRLLACGHQGRKYLRLDVTEAALTLGEPRERLVKALNYLEEQGDITLQVEGVRQGYRKLRPLDSDSLSQALADRFEAREQADLGRLRHAVHLLSMEGCITNGLWGYFGETRPAPCGHCGGCEGVARESVPVVLPPPVLGLASPVPDGPALQTARQQTRFLCGIASPMTTRAKLTRHAMFGCLSSSPFLAVLQWIQARRAKDLALPEGAFSAGCD